MGCGLRRQAYYCPSTDNSLNYLQHVASCKLLRNVEYCSPKDSVSYPAILHSLRKRLWRIISVAWSGLYCVRTGIVIM